MLMLEDLKKRKQLSDSLISSLSFERYMAIIFNGKAKLNCIIDNNQASDCVNILESSDIAFVGASHGNVMGPIFALDISSEEGSAVLKIYLSYYNNKNISSSKIKNELTMLAVATSFHYPYINKIVLPDFVDEFDNSECSIKRFSQNTIMYINN